MEEKEVKKENKEKKNENKNKKSSSKQIHQEDYLGAENINIKYPFSGVAPNLIDKFLVIGYEQKTIDKAYQNYMNMGPDPDYNTKFNCIEFEESPTIINEICHDYSKNLLENEHVIEIIFPEIPKMYFLNKNIKETEDNRITITPYSVLFSLNPQDNNGSKKSYNGLGYVFYNKKEHKLFDNQDGYFYLPVCYVIMSEYPYFYHFNEICKNIYLLMTKEREEIPMEIILYNLVKFCPSPVNKSINILLGAPLGVTANTIISELSTLESNKGEKLGTPSIFFNQLSGYPFLDFNVSYIFELISLDIIIETFIFSFLEHDIIFYSSSPEVLNAVMYLFANLNYPLNDSIYYWHVLSVSEDTFMNSDSVFVGKTSSTLTGIIGKYDPEVKTTLKIREHFVLDIDNKYFGYLFQDETENVKKTLALLEYIRECTADFEDNPIDETKFDKEQKERKKKLFNDGIQLYESIYTLMNELMRGGKKVKAYLTNKEKKERKEMKEKEKKETNKKPNKKESFFNMYEDESEIERMKINARLQKAFLSFIIKIVQKFVSILGVENEDKNNESMRKRFDSIVVKDNKEKLNE